MGGYGSSRWGLHDKAVTVEECLVVDVAKVAKGASLVAASGTIHWGREDHPTAESVAYRLRPAGGGAVLTLDYGCGDGGEGVELTIRLESTTPHYGGRRWWGRCSLVVDGKPCGRRVRKLYLPPGARYFGCRGCHGLTYASAQGHDKRADLFRRQPEVLEKLLTKPGGISTGQLGSMLKTLSHHDRDQPASLGEFPLTDPETAVSPRDILLEVQSYFGDLWPVK